MFEDSTFASTGRLRTRSRAGLVAATFFDTAVVLALALAPLLNPHMLPRVFIPFLLNVPAVPVEQTKPQPHAARVEPAVLKYNPFQAPTRIPPHPYIPDKPEPRIILNPSDFADSRMMTGDGGPFGPAKPVTVKQLRIIRSVCPSPSLKV